MDIVVASTEADHHAVETVKAHHAKLAGALRARTGTVLEAARQGQDVAAARDALLAWASDELLPHAAAEEQTLYAAAAERPEGRLLVEALVADHRAIKELVDRLARPADAVTTAAAAAGLEATFLTHMEKENEQVLPLLAADRAVSVADLVAGMHEELGGSGHAESGEHVATTEGCGGTCTCGEKDAPGDVELDARGVPHAIRHATIFGALDSLGAGAALVLVAPHDPLPLLAQLDQRSPGAFDVSYLERGPESWRLRLLRRTA